LGTVSREPPSPLPRRAALHWDEYGGAEHADLERRNVDIERAAPQLERDRAEFIERKRAASTA